MQSHGGSSSNNDCLRPEINQLLFTLKYRYALIILVLRNHYFEFSLLHFRNDISITHKLDTERLVHRVKNLTAIYLIRIVEHVVTNVV